MKTSVSELPSPQMFGMQVWRREREEGENDGGEERRSLWMSSFPFLFFMKAREATQWRRFDKSHYAKAAPESFISIHANFPERGADPPRPTDAISYFLIMLSCPPQSGHYRRRTQPLSVEKNQNGSACKWRRGSVSAQFIP